MSPVSFVKSAFGIFFAFLLFLNFYLPSFIGNVEFQIYGPSIPLKKVIFLSWILLNLNSSLTSAQIYLVHFPLKTQRTAINKPLATITNKDKKKPMFDRRLKISPD